MAKIKKRILVELEAPDQRMLRYGSHINFNFNFIERIVDNTEQKGLVRK